MTDTADEGLPMGGVMAGRDSRHSGACAEVRDLAAGFVLRAVEPDEANRIERHLRGCPPCARLIAELRRPVGRLPFLAPPASPSVDVKVALLARIAQASAAPAEVPRPFRALPAAPLTVPASRPVAPPAAEPGRRRLPFGRRDRVPTALSGWQVLAAPLATVPLILALTIVGGWAVSNQMRLSDTEAQVEALEGELLASRTENQRLAAEVAALNSIDGTDVAQVYTITDNSGTAARPIGEVKVYAESGAARLVLRNLTGVTPDTWYEVRLQERDGTMVSAGEFQIDDEGEGSATLDLDQPFTSYAAMLVRPMTSRNHGKGASGSNAAQELVVEIAPGLGVQLDTDAVPYSR